MQRLLKLANKEFPETAADPRDQPLGPADPPARAAQRQSRPRRLHQAVRPAALDQRPVLEGLVTEPEDLVGANPVVHGRGRREAVAAGALIHASQRRENRDYREENERKSIRTCENTRDNRVFDIIRFQLSLLLCGSSSALNRSFSLVSVLWRQDACPVGSRSCRRAG